MTLHHLYKASLQLSIALLVAGSVMANPEATVFARMEQEAMNLVLTGSKEQVEKFGTPALKIVANLSESNQYDTLSKRIPFFKTEIHHHVLRPSLPRSWTPEGVRPLPPSTYAQLIMTLCALDFSKAKVQFFDHSDATEDEKIVFLWGLEMYAKNLQAVESLEAVEFLSSQQTSHSNKNIETYIQDRVLPAVLARAKELHKENPTVLKQLSELDSIDPKSE